ncbi:cobalamin-independent methionine synthase II family protein [Nocardia sp. NPDC059246]|uniref:cobalamin-independent methionine synthase II family protein n=1 Tax=unclassified Nocardia TaxID=2637762 RepID=UPI003687DA2D
MKRSENRILTSHAGALHMPKDLQELVLAEWRDEPRDQDKIERRLTESVDEVVRKQTDAGIDIVSDGEFTKSSWMGYASQRLDGIAVRPGVTWYDAKGKVGQSKDFQDFQDFYTEASDHMTWFDPGAETEARKWAMSLESICEGPIKYSGQAAIARDIANLKAATSAQNVEEAFLPVVAPGSVQPWIRNEHYSDDESLFADLAAALKEEYKAIIDAGLICQIDDAFIPGEWDRRMLDPDWDLDRYKRWVNMAVEAVNYAIDGLPEDRIRYHICWGSSHKPHSTDIPLYEIVEYILKVNAQTYVIEAANARHEWEWKVWEDVKLPEGKILMPGVLEHATYVIEHPETIAQRILRFASVVGRENVIAGTDCGLRGRTHPQIAWAKLKVLGEGAALASRELWRK